MLGRPTEYAEAVGALGQVVPKRPAGLSVSPITRSQTNLDMHVKESGPVRADEFDLQRVDEFGPTSADGYVVQEAEELKHVLAPIAPSKAEVESHNVSHLPFWFGALRVSVAEDFSLGHRKVDTKEAEQIPTVSVDYRFFWAIGRPST